jgi:hypothetical protein
MLAHLLQLALQAGDLVADEAAVRLELRLAGATGADPPLQTLEVRPLARQPRQEVLVLGELDLEGSLAGVGVLGEDVEDEGGAVEDLDLERFLQVALLRG